MQQETTVLTELYQWVLDNEQPTDHNATSINMADLYKKIEELASAERKQIKKAFRAGKAHCTDDWHEQLYLSITYKKFGQ